jgi:hypothetical protein
VPRGKKKNVKMTPTRTTKPQRGNKGTAPLTRNIGLDGSCVVSFTPRSLYPAGKRPRIGLNYEARRAPDPVWLSWRSLEPAGIRNPGSSSPLPNHRTDYAIAARTLWLHFQRYYSSPFVTEIILPRQIPEATRRSTTV